MHYLSYREHGPLYIYTDSLNDRKEARDGEAAVLRELYLCGAAADAVVAADFAALARALDA